MPSIPDRVPAHDDRATAAPVRQILPPPLRAAPFVHYLQMEAAAPGVHRLPASPFPIVVAVLSGEVAFGDADDGWSPVSSLFVGGPFLRPLRYRAAPHTTFVAALMSPGSLHRLFGLAQSELTDDFWPLDELTSPRTAASLRDALCGETSLRAVADRLCDTLLAGATRPPSREPFASLADAAQALRDRPASRRQFERRFSTTYGMSLRDARKLARFSRALSLVTGRSGGRLAHIAQDCGYFDQAQMARDFAALAGFAPAVLARSHDQAGMGIFHYSTEERGVLLRRERVEPLLRYEA